MAKEKKEKKQYVPRFPDDVHESRLWELVGLMSGFFRPRDSSTSWGQEEGAQRHSRPEKTSDHSGVENNTGS